VILNRSYSAIGSVSLFALAAACGNSSSASGGASAGSAGVASSAGGAVGSSGNPASSSGAPSAAGASGGTAQGGAGAGGTAQGGAGAGGTAQGGAGGVGVLLVPPSGVTFGSFVGDGDVAGLEALLGRKIAIHHNFFSWGDDYSGPMSQDFNAGRVPLVTWEAWQNSVGTSLDQIVAGTLDSVIHRNAAAVKALRKPFFLRWGHEMNGNWYPWSGSMNGAAAGGAAKFIAAYRHIHDVFKADGALNTLWVFCPNVSSVPGDDWNGWANYYPGDDYVDWMCVDGYNWGTTMTGSSWQAFQAIFSGIYPGLAAKNKPIIVAETASTEMGGDKAAWITAILPALKGSFPAIKAFVWFDINKETDWRINSSPASQTAFVSIVSDPYFNP